MTLNAALNEGVLRRGLSGAAVGLACIRDALQQASDLDIQRVLRLVLAGRTNGREGHIETIAATRIARQLGLALTLDLYGAPLPGQERHRDMIINHFRGAPWATYLGEYIGRPPFEHYDLALVLPAALESFRLTPIEAWAYGCRSMGIPRGGALEALQLADGILRGATPNAIARALLWFARHSGRLGLPRANAPASYHCTLEKRNLLWARTPVW